MEDHARRRHSERLIPEHEWREFREMLKMALDDLCDHTIDKYSAFQTIIRAAEEHLRG